MILHLEETMERRQFLAASIATSAAALAGNATAQAPASAAREFYQLRRYTLMSGPQLKLTENYFADALIPALARMGMGPVGAFKLDYRAGHADLLPADSRLLGWRRLRSSICNSARTRIS